MQKNTGELIQVRPKKSSADQVIADLRVLFGYLSSGHAANPLGSDSSMPRHTIATSSNANVHRQGVTSTRQEHLQPHLNEERNDGEGDWTTTGNVGSEERRDENSNDDVSTRKASSAPWPQFSSYA